MTSKPSFAAGRAILIVTTLAGTLDIIAAHFHIWAAGGKFPLHVFRAIAGGALGKERSTQGGAEVVALGVFFHYFISFAFTCFFFVIYPRLSLLRKNLLATSVAYTLCVWCVMSLIVLPLSARNAPLPNLANKHTYIGFVVLLTVFGAPIVLGADRFHRRHAS